MYAFIPIHQVLRHNYFKVGQNLGTKPQPHAAPQRAAPPMITPQKPMQPAHAPAAARESPFRFDHHEPKHNSNTYGNQLKANNVSIGWLHS